jgi:hypothetical protein
LDENPIAVLDACVLYPAPLRDVLMSLATAKEAIYQARWTAAILDEWTRNLLKDRPDLNKSQLDYTIEMMSRAVPEGLVTGYERKIQDIRLPNIDDRHVLAAAIAAKRITS